MGECLAITNIPQQRYPREYNLLNVCPVNNMSASQSNTQEARPDGDSGLLPVLIAGAGPTGLIMAADLSRRGIKFRIVDKAPKATEYSKAIVLHARTLELLENMGIVDRFLDEGLPIRGSNFICGGKKIVHLNMDEIESHYKFLLSIPQSRTENILSNYVQENGHLIERNLELVDLVDYGDFVEATLEDKTNGKKETLRCLYLVGADGAHSIVRKKLGFTFEGSEYPEMFGAADVACDISGDEVNGYLSEHGICAIFPFGEGRFRIIFDFPDGTIDGVKIENDTKTELTLAQVKKIVEERAISDIEISDPQWLALFRIHKRFSSHYAKGRVFICGDAAHIHSPVGGVGMNTGMQDAINLSWKLSLRIQGVAADALLDTYEEERRKVGQSVLKGTHMATKFVTLRHPVALNIRNSLVHLLASQELVQQRILRAGSMTGVSYRASSLSIESHPPIDDSLGRTLRLGGHDEDADEKPGLGAWIEFARAPVAGDRVLDGECQNAKGETVRLCQTLVSPRFQLLLFDGYVASAGGYEDFSRIEKHMQKYFGDFIDVHVIVPVDVQESVALKLPPYKSVLFDAERNLHKTYGASSECLYLIRPDGYIGFRSQPADLDELVKYLTGVFLMAPVKS